MSARRFTLICVLVASSLLAAACTKTSSTADQSSPPSTTPPATSTSTETVSPSTTPSESPSASPSGSPALEDGRYFGYIKSVDFSTSPASLVFDLAYFYTGDKANQEAAARGDETPVPNDYYIVNDNPLPRTLAVDTGVEIYVTMLHNLCCDLQKGTLNGFIGGFNLHTYRNVPYEGSFTQYWLTISNGAVVKVEEQYLP